MRTRSTRWLRTLVLTIIPTSFIAAAFVLVPGSAASAAVPSITTMGGPINVLPSAVRSATGSYSGVEYMAAYLYKASKSPEFWTAYKSAQTAAASKGGELVLSPQVAAEAKTVYPLASKAAPFVKVAGGVGTAMTAYQLASSLSNGVQDLIGLDATGTVCRGVGQDLWGKVVATAAGANCSKIWDFDPDFKVNTDASGQWSSGNVCHTFPNGGIQCVQLVGSASRQVSSSSSDWANGDGDYRIPLRCFKADNGRGGFEIRTQSGKTYSATNDSGKNWWNADFPDNPANCRSALGWPSAGGKPDEITGIRYGSQGDFEPAGKGSADPSRTLKCVVAGTDGKEYVRESDPFFESAGVLPDPKCPDLPQEVQPDTTKIVETGGDEGDQPIWSTKSDPAVLDATKNGCGTSTGTQCELQLFKDNESCFAGADCQGWKNDPDQSKYRCEYGGKPVALSECTVYAPRWEPQAQQTGNTLGDPQTGKPLPNPKPELSPGSSANAGSTPADTATDLGPNDCLKNMPFSLNPISWVVNPFKCMFITRPGYTDQLQATSAKAWEKTTPLRYAAAIGNWNLTTPANGCSGIPIVMQYGVLDIDTHILAACPGDTLAPMAGWSRLFVGFSMSVVGVYALLRWGGALFGFEAFARKGDDD